MRMWAPDIVHKLGAILEPGERRKLVVLFAAMIAMAMFEVAGIASVMPFMSLVAEPGAVRERPWLWAAYEFLGFESDQAFLFAMGLGILVLLVGANAFSAFTRWLQYKFSYDSAHSLARRLLTTYLAQPYAFFLTHNSSDMGKQVLAEVNAYVNNLLYPATELCARLVVSACIFALLVAVDPALAVGVLVVLGGAYVGIYLTVRRSLARSGEERLEAVRERFKTATEALSGVKPIKVQGGEAFFEERFGRASRTFATLQARYNIIGEAPRYFVEALAFGSVILVVLYLLAREASLQAVVPLLSLYAFAGYRLLPSLQKLYKAFTNVRYFYPIVDSIYDDLQLGTPGGAPALSASNGTPLRFERAITFHDVHYRYPGTEADVLARIDATIERGARVAFVGSTGAGKTTLIDLLMGLLTPTSGTIAVDGEALDGEALPAWRHLVGYVPQEVFLIDDTVTRNIAFGLPDEAVDAGRVRWAAGVAQVGAFVEEELPGGYDTVIGERGIRLSGGQRQRLGLARALYRMPRVLVLDEATSALDGITEDAVLQAIGALPYEVTMVMIAHRLATVRHCDYIYLLADGRVADEGTYQHLLEASAVFRGMARLSS